ncbi:MAG: hypothetical protein DRJ03_21700 [Chloroflexi bacterium]|nr:MAG: hypothetical protein DRI81_17240 [Chloroflexota bacterium]RLC80450.1 MAG: hypothetical protein DRJ03_21700 [Chloroflexota bacterium]
MFNDVVTVPKLGDFIVDVQPSRVRLCLEERQSGKHIVDVTLDLQGFNEFGTVIWLSQTIKIQCTPHDNNAQQVTWMRSLEGAVRRDLEGMGYQVRPGRHVLPASYRPLNGDFDYASTAYVKLKRSLNL